MSANVPARIRPRKHRIFVVDDHPVMREGFARLLGCQSDLLVCGQADTIDTALVGIATSKPDLAIVDLMLGRSNGMDLIKEIKAVHPSLLIFVLSSHDESVYAERALRAGAKGYAMKETPTIELMDAIHRVLRGEVYLSEAARVNVVYNHLHGPTAGVRTELDELTDRELEIFHASARAARLARLRGICS